MDDLTKKLLRRLAQTVLEVLDERSVYEKPLKKDPLDLPELGRFNKTIPIPVTFPGPQRLVGVVTEQAAPVAGARAPVDPASIGKGAMVRFWDGNRHVVGKVVAIPRGKPRKLKIRVTCEGKRSRTHTVEDDRVVFIRAGGEA